MGVSAFGYTLWECYLGFWLTSTSLIPIFLSIAIPAGLLLLITHRNEIRHWTIIPALIFAGCTGLSIMDIWRAFPNSFDSWSQFSFQMALLYLARFLMWFTPVFVFYGTFNLLKHVFPSRKSAEPGATANASRR